MLLDGNAPHALGLAGPFEIAAEDEKSEPQEKDVKDATKVDADVKDAVSVEVRFCYRIQIGTYSNHCCELQTG